MIVCPTIRVWRPMRQLVLNESVEDPPEPSPTKLPPEARALWDECYRVALDYYGKGNSEYAAKTAWRIVRLNYDEALGWMPRRYTEAPTRMRLENPGDCVVLGKAVEFSFVTKDGTLEVKRFDDKLPPDLLWSDAMQALLVLPRSHKLSCQLVQGNPQHSAANLYKRWTQRNASQVCDIEVPQVTMNPLGLADTVVYRSDKWHRKNPKPGLSGSQEYIHAFHLGKIPIQKGVWSYRDTVTTHGKPYAICIRGGKLALHERGIIH